MDLRVLASTGRTKIGVWTATALLSLGAWLAGVGLVAPICYWQGVQRWQWEGRFRPAAYSPDAAPLAAIALALFAVWAGLWLLHMRGVWRRKLSLLHALAPMAVFAWTAWDASLMSYPCNPL